MSPSWIISNVMEAWTYRGGWADFLRRLRWIYAGKLPRGLSRDEQLISFCFPNPIDRITVLVRSNGGSDAFIFGEVFHHRYYELPLAAAPGTILDLGANVGFTAIYLGRRFPGAQIACVEPIPENVRLLRRNCELNDIDARIFSAAVAINDGEALMELSKMDYGHRILENRAVCVGPSLTVEAVTIPTLMRRLGWRRINLLKVDIEGYERTLFAGDCGWLADVDSMCIECHEGFGDDDLRRIAKDYGFREAVRLPGIWYLERA